MGSLVINRQSLDCYCGHDRFHIDLPATVLNNLEVIDKDGFKKIFSDFINNNKLKNKDFTVFYSPEVTFEKAFVQGEDIKNFYNEVPFAPEKALKKEINQEAAVLGIVVNGEFITLFDEINVLRVVPIGPLGFKDYDPKIWQDQKKINEYTLYLKESQHKKISKLMMTEIVMIIIMIPLGSYFIYSAFFKHVEPPKDIIAVTVSPTPIPEIKRTLKIQILNASGKIGYAGKLKDYIGDPTIETGNATVSATSSIIFNQVATDEANLIINKLKTFGADVASKSASISGNFDVQIVLGRK